MPHCWKSHVTAHMLWLLKRTIWMRRFFWAPKKHVKTDGRIRKKLQNLFDLILYVSVNSYGHVKTVSSPNHTFFSERLISTNGEYTFACNCMTTTKFVYLDLCYFFQFSIWPSWEPKKLWVSRVMEVPLKMSLPLLGIGIFTLLLSLVFCCYMWKWVGFIGSESMKKWIFSYLSVLTLVLGAQKKCLIETVLLSTHNIIKFLVEK